MPSTNFLIFDINKGNMMSDANYNSNSQRTNGLQSGIASSSLQNKFQYQVSLAAYAIAEFIRQNGLDANDTDRSTFVSNLVNSFLGKVLDKATQAEAEGGLVDTKWLSPQKAKYEINTIFAEGSYSGTGTYGSNNKNQLTFNFEPRLVVITDSDSYYQLEGYIPWIKGQTTGPSFIGSNSSGFFVQGSTLIWGNNSLQWYSEVDAYRQLNYTGHTYKWLAIGAKI